MSNPCFTTLSHRISSECCRWIVPLTLLTAYVSAQAGELAGELAESDLNQSVVVLSGYTAELSGPPIQQERGQLTHWHDPQSAASWSIAVEKPCLLKVEVEAAVQEPFAGSPYRVLIGEHEFRGAMEDTGGWENYRVFSLGEGNVAAGVHKVRLQPSTLMNGVFGNIRSLRITGRHVSQGKSKDAPDTSGPVRVFTSAQLRGSRICEQDSLKPTARVSSESVTIVVDPAETFQEIEGFGGAFTEAAAMVFSKLSPSTQEELLRAYFDAETGHGYNLCRTHINSCDFSVGNYAYTEVDGDVALEHFSIDHDRRHLIPLIHAAQRTACDRGIKLLASPWSPPAWMKTNGQMTGGGKLKPEYRDAWARYYCRYIEEYAKEGIDIWGLTVQNEPNATQRWESCLYSAEEERDFVRDYLGPTLHGNGLEHVKLLVWDHNRDQLFDRAKTVFDDPGASKYVWGAGFHWYVSDEYHHAQMVRDFYPDKNLLFTEGCLEGGPHAREWSAGERYAHSIINDLNHGATGWIDWNILLNTEGGPNHVGNYCSAPVLADTKRDRLIFNSSYYYLGHFSRFIRPGALRLLSGNTGTELLSTAFRNVDGSIVVVVLNEQEYPIQYALTIGSLQTEAISAEHSITTLLLDDSTPVSGP